MKYMLLLLDSPENATAPGTPEEAAEMEAWFAYDKEIEAAGVVVDSHALLPASTATTLRVRDGKSLTTDGPFAETKEHLGGYYVIDVADLDAALEWAAKAPCAPRGSVEVRPVMVFGAE